MSDAQALDQLVETAAGSSRRGAGWEPPLPLILAAWWEATDEEKRERFLLHIHWAHEHGELQKVYDFITRLRPEDWHRED